jgi:hypothetical protein
MNTSVNSNYTIHVKIYMSITEHMKKQTHNTKSRTQSYETNTLLHQLQGLLEIIPHERQTKLKSDEPNSVEIELISRVRH